MSAVQALKMNTQPETLSLDSENQALFDTVMNMKALMSRLSQSADAMAVLGALLAKHSFAELPEEAAAFLGLQRQLKVLTNSADQLVSQFPDEQPQIVVTKNLN